MNLVSTCLTDVTNAFSTAKRDGNREHARAEYRRLTETMLAQAQELDAEQRATVMNEITRDESGLLLGIGLSAALWSVRDWKPERLRFGLLALMLENQREDYRETLAYLCLLNHSASKLGVDLSQLYYSLRSFASRETAQLFDGYFREGEKDISAMGYEETDEEGFGYRRAW